MKILLLLLFLSSCGKAPFFKSLQDTGNNDSTISAISEDSIHTLNKTTNFGLRWIESPNTSQKSSFQINFWDLGSGHYLGPYLKLEKDLCVFLWMTMPDGSEHGSSPVIIQENENGYLVDDLYFIMTCNWELYIRTVESINDCTNEKNSNYLDQYVFKITL